MIEIDGSVLEGCGQVLRIAVSLSCLIQEPVCIYNIRIFRNIPGLLGHHKSGIDLLKKISNANVQGCTIGSTEIVFSPGSIKGGKFSADTETEGSIALLLQAALPVLCFADQTSSLDLRGGTETLFGPQIDFISEILRPNLQKFGVTFDLKLHKRGYYPHGGGHVEVTINPVKVINSTQIIEFGQVKQFFGWSFVSGSLSKCIAKDMKEGVVNSLPPTLTNVPINIQVYEENREVTERDGSGITVGFETTNGCKIGSSGSACREQPPIFALGNKIGRELMVYANYQACTDIYVQDQLLIFMALSKGISRIRTVVPTLHTKTAIQNIEKMTNASFNILHEKVDEWIIECRGIGFVNNQI